MPTTVSETLVVKTKSVWDTTSMTSKARPKRNWDFGRSFGHHLADVLPKQVCESAAATCRFYICGPNSVGDTARWGAKLRWIRTRLQTYGHQPRIVGAWQSAKDWISADCNEAAEAILGCFNLTIADVYAKFGKPSDGCKYIVDLIDIVTALAPEYLQETAA